MSLAALTPTSTAATAAASTAATTNGSSLFSSQLDGDAFLTLFLTQLQYQDPTNPMESYEMASQLAQFSSVEKLAAIDSSLTALQASLASVANAQMVGLIGKQVVAYGNNLQVTNGTPTDGKYSFDLDSGTADVTIKISDADGNVVRTIKVGSQAGGEYEVNWDGLDDSGKKVADGAYTYAVEAADSSGKSLEVTSTLTGIAYSFRLDSSTPYLILDGANGVKVPISNILEIKQASTT